MLLLNSLLLANRLVKYILHPFPPSPPLYPRLQLSRKTPKTQTNRNLQNHMAVPLCFPLNILRSFWSFPLLVSTVSLVNPPPEFAM